MTQHESVDALAGTVEDACRRAAGSPGVDAYDVRGASHEDLTCVLRSGRVSGGASNARGGIGVRVFCGAGVGFASTVDLEPEAVRAAVDGAVRLARANAQRRWRSFAPAMGGARRASYRPAVRGDPHEVGRERIAALLERAADGARDAAPDANVVAQFGSRRDRWILADSAGSSIETGSLLSTLLVKPFVKEGSHVGDATEWRSGERGVDDFETDGGPEELGRLAGRLALEALHAGPAPPGRHRVMTDPELTGLLAHESFGHLTEYDLVAPGWSVLDGRLGERLGAPAVTIRDAPVVDGGARQGVAVPIDQEGLRGSTVTLLDRGVLAGWMHVRDSARTVDHAPTGNGRALYVTHPPIVRMSNTFIEAGHLSFEEVLEDVKDGVYAVGSRGGQVDTAKGSFQFSAQEAYRIKNGQLAGPLRDVSLTGFTLETLANIDAVSNEWALGDPGYCGKGQYVPVGDGGPHLRIRNAIVGGSA